MTLFTLPNTSLARYLPEEAAENTEQKEQRHVYPSRFPVQCDPDDLAHQSGVCEYARASSSDSHDIIITKPIMHFSMAHNEDCLGVLIETTSKLIFKSLHKGGY